MGATERFTHGAIDQHLSWLTSQGRSENTLRAYKADLKCLIEYAGGEFVMDAFETQAAEYLNEIRKTQSPKTVNRKLGTYRGFAQRAGFPDCLADYRAPTPARSIAHPVKGGVDALLKMYEVAEAEDNHDLMSLIALCGFQGLRVHEARAATPADLDLQNMTIRVRGKGDKTEIIPLYRRTFKLLLPAFAIRDDHEPFSRYSDRGARYAITRVARKAGVGHVASHDLRSTFGTEVYRQSKNLRATQEILRHASSKTTEGYTHISMDDMRRAGEL